MFRSKLFIRVLNKRKNQFEKSSGRTVQFVWKQISTSIVRKDETVNTLSVTDLNELASRIDETLKERSRTSSLSRPSTRDPAEVRVPSRFQTLKLHSCRGSIIGFSFCLFWTPWSYGNFEATRSSDCKSDSPCDIASSKKRFDRIS